MDLSKLDMTKFADEGAPLEIVHPATLEPLMHDEKPVTIWLLGQDSTIFRDEIQRRAKSQLNKRQKIDIDKVAGDSADLLAVLTVGWYGIEEGGKALECTRENAKSIYQKYGWLRQQVDEFIGDRANFFKA